MDATYVSIGGLVLKLFCNQNQLNYLTRLFCPKISSLTVVQNYILEQEQLKVETNSVMNPFHNVSTDTVQHLVLDVVDSCSHQDIMRKRQSNRISAAEGVWSCEL